jgi:topoisomerase IA-like protein
MAQIRAPLFEEKVVDFICEMADVTDTTVSIEALMAEPGAAVEEKPAKKAPAKKAPAKKAAVKKAPAKKPAAKKAPAKKAPAKDDK